MLGENEDRRSEEHKFFREEGKTMKVPGSNLVEESSRNSVTVIT